MFEVTLANDFYEFQLWTEQFEWISKSAIL